MDRPPFQPGATFNTPLGQLHEMAFRQWLTQNQVPFNPSAGTTDYDMRGFYQALQQGNPVAQTAVNPNDQQMHYPDFWKTPLHQSFSSESQWARPGAPQWINDSQLAAPNGKVVFDERAPRGILGNIGLK
jgi:hypothetical protein